MKKIFLFLSLSCISLFSFSQAIEVQGTVMDMSNNEPLPGVNVIVESTTNGVITDFNGNFKISVESEEAVLVFSFVGFLDERITVGNQRNIQINLSPDITSLDEVVVIGYGKVKKADATGAVAVVSSEDFDKGPTYSAEQLMAGKTAGVSVTSNSGAPGNASTIRIRGGSSLNASNDPLIIIDGVPTENSVMGGAANQLASINANDIETFTILKDASATAIYGSRASNGVIIITTKRGGKKFSVNYSTDLSLATIPKMVEVYSGDEYRALMNEKFSGKDRVLSILGTENTDWQSEIYQQAFGQNHNLSFSGQALSTPYRVSLGYTNADGILKTYKFERTTLALAVDPSFFNDYLKININVKGMSNNNNFADQGAVANAVYYDPTKPVYNDNLRWRGYNTWTSYGSDINGPPIPLATPNPVAQLELTDNTSKVLSSIGNIQLDYKMHFLPELRANLNAGYDYTTSQGHNNVMDSTQWINTPVASGGRYNPYENKRRNEVFDFYLNYAKDLDGIESKIDVMAGYSWSHFWRSNVDSLMDYHKLAGNPANDFQTEYYLVSFFGRLNYTYKERYLLTLTLRDDATSRFAPEHRWGLFPSAAFAWKINEEAFMSNSKNISDLKLRLGYGVTGQQDVTTNNYPYFAKFTRSNETARYQFGNDFYYTLRPDGYDYNIKWEETTTTNIGLDFGFYNNRITASVDGYIRNTKDLISYVDVPVGTNFAARILTNIGTMENKGAEFNINAAVISKKDFSWNLGYNVSYNQTKITKLNLNDDPDYVIETGSISGTTSGMIQAHKVGYPANSFYVYKQVYDIDGKPLEDVYVDRNEDGIINSSDLYIYKKPDADVLMGIVSNMNYKNWDFSFSGRASIGNYVYNNVSSRSTYNDLHSSLDYNMNAPKSLNETQFQSGGKTTYSDYFIENGSFFRMDNISLGYKFSKLLKERLSIHLNLSVHNAFIITNYSGLDPEINGGRDNNFFPRTRAYSLGINCQF